MTNFFLRHRPALLTALFLPLGVAALRAQDLRTIVEPKFPASCKTIAAPLSIQSTGLLAPSSDTDTESAAETATIQSAINSCTTGQAVELSLGSSTSFNAFLINPLTIPAGVALLVDGGVTVFGTRNPVNYQVTGSRATCGINGTYQGGCKSLLNFTGSNSGLYGYGIIDDRGYGPISTGANAGQSWWIQTINNVSPQYQNIPMLMNITGDNFTAYKITLRNSPFWNFYWVGSGLIVWGVKIETPWNIPNTDGIDISGSNVTVTDTTISNGDDQIAIDAFSAPAQNITIQKLTGYSRNGISIGSSTEKGVSNVLVQNVNLTGDVVSLNGTTVNGVTEASLKSSYGLTGYAQALPAISGHLRGLNIKTVITRGGSVSNVTYSNACITDINYPITIQPYDGTVGTLYPSVTNILYSNIHVLAPSSQYVASPDNTDARYLFDFEGYPPVQPSQFTFDNVVFDDLTTGGSSIQIATATDDIITTKTNVYPAVLSQLTSPYNSATNYNRSTYGNTSLLLNDNTYASATTTSNPSLAYTCPTNAFPYTVGELYLSQDSATNLSAANITAGGTVILNAMLQPVMSQTTLFIPKSYNLTPGTVAVGAPGLTKAITFYEGSIAVGSASLAANGTLASFNLTNIPVGTHTYTAQYPGDTYYSPITFGSVSVTAAPIASALTLDLSTSTIYTGGAVLLTATASSGTSGVPVTFFNGSATLGTATTNSSGVATFVFTAGAASTSDSLSASLPASGNYAAASSTSHAVTVVPPATIVLASSTLNIAAGSSGAVTLLLTPGGTYSGAVSFSCSTAVAYVTCSPTSATINLNGVTASTFTQTINVAATVSAVQTGNISWLASLAPLSLVCLVLRSRKRPAFLVFTLLCIFCIVSILGCGKSTLASTTNPGNRPSGTQVINITTTVAGTTQTFPVTININ